MKREPGETAHGTTEIDTFSTTGKRAESKPEKSHLALDRLTRQAGITINGNNPWDIQVRDERFYEAVLGKWSLGLGEAYMDGYWDCQQLDNCITRFLRSGLDGKALGWARLPLIFGVIQAKFRNLQSKKRAFQIGEQHYDTGNDLFENMLDSRLIYSCGYWENAHDLEQAQEDKLEMICRKLQLKTGEKLLDIGCGWGGLMAYAARQYGVEATGVTVSREQRQYALDHYKDLPLKIELSDYRDLQGKYDKIVSVGMFEHVGAKNYATFFNTAQRLLKDDGLFLLHTIGNASTTLGTDPWISKYIFPNSSIPSAVEITKALERRFLIEDWHNFGQDYDRTLMAWYDRFENAWPKISPKYGERFHRMWKYYLLCCAGFFRSRQGQLWQLVLTKRERTDTYRSLRPASLT
ncbi:MAG TPA: cyclopropane fatty acyl phospholipid synthase [Desulfobulbaceae bacterium]|nr:cyclopropane fatty acyl phospholipid synthase [Desulfobulbaceae bacterium]